MTGQISGMFPTFIRAPASCWSDTASNPPTRGASSYVAYSGVEAKVRNPPGIIGTIPAARNRKTPRTG
jgi:hypothetical protein